MNLAEIFQERWLLIKKARALSWGPYNGRPILQVPFDPSRISFRTKSWTPGVYLEMTVSEPEGDDDAGNVVISRNSYTIHMDSFEANLKQLEHEAQANLTKIAERDQAVLVAREKAQLVELLKKYPETTVPNKPTIANRPKKKGG